MARIRSTHPGQWTDEDFVMCSPAARLLSIGLRNEADDRGVFEWKPVTIKMRLMPADDVDVAALLAELEANRQVRRFEAGGKAYGAIRNFRKYQRPKKPTAVHPLPEEMRGYVGLKAEEADAEPVEDEYGTGEEILPRREEEGEKRKEGVGGDISAARPAKQVSRKRASRFEGPVPDEWLTWSRRRFPHVDAAFEASKFSDFWAAKSGAGAVKLDWPATWRNWIRRASEGPPGSRASPPKPLARAPAAIAYDDDWRKDVSLPKYPPP